MQSVDETLILLKRQAVLEAAMKQRGGIRVTEEQELHVVRRRLADFPEEIQAVIQAAHALRLPIGKISVTDVENWASTTRVS